MKRYMKINCLNTRKINKFIDNLSKELEEQMKGIQINNSNYNSMDMCFSGTPLYLQLNSYMNENIFPAMGFAKYAKSPGEKMFFCNYLCILLYSFIELYAQCLNVYYDLDLMPIHKASNENVMLYGGIVQQTKQGLIDISGKVVSIESVINELSKKFQANEYFEMIKKILEVDEIRRLKELRNNQLHYQPIFGRFNQSYMPGKEGFFTFNVSPYNANIHKEEYAEFLSLSEKIVREEIKLIYYFYKMVTDKKMLLKEEKEKELCVVKCTKCKMDLLLPEEIISYMKVLGVFPTFPHNNECDGKVNLDIIRKINVHPEKYRSIAYDALRWISEENC